MRLRLTAALLTLVVASTAGCSGNSTAPTSAESFKESCEEFGSWMADAYRDTDQEGAETRSAYFARQEQSIRSMASTTDDTALTAALNELADGYAGLAAGPGPEGSKYPMPAVTSVLELCKEHIEAEISVVSSSAATGG